MSHSNPPGPPAGGRQPLKKGELPGIAADAIAGQRMRVPGSFMPRAAVPTTHPRKVKNGLRLASRSGPVTNAWSGQRWMRLVEDFAAPGAMAEGIVYARSGQTRALNIIHGHIHASVQGRMPYPYTVDIRLPIITAQQWGAVIDAMTGEARHVAGLLAGEVPPNIEDLFSPLRLRLFPHETTDLTVACSCGQCTPSAPAGTAPGTAAGWCKHVAAVMALVAERLAADTFLIFAIRGIERDELLEQLRARRTRATQRTADGQPAPTDARPVPVYLPRLPGLAEPAPLEQQIEHFWTLGPALHQIDLTMREPDVTHPLLRRLGSSPFDASQGARFPLVGLLATCYDVVTQHTLAAEQTPPERDTQH